MMEQTHQPSAAEPIAPAISSDERAWAAIAHASALITMLFGAVTGGALCLVGPIVPLVIWLVFRERSRFVARHALQATVFQALVVVISVAIAILGLVLVVAAWVGTIMLMAAIVGILLIPVALALTLLWGVVSLGLPVAALVYACYGAYEVAEGRDFRYYLVGHWVD